MEDKVVLKGKFDNAGDIAILKDCYEHIEYAEVLKDFALTSESDTERTLNISMVYDLEQELGGVLADRFRCHCERTQGVLTKDFVKQFVRCLDEVIKVRYCFLCYPVNFDCQCNDANNRVGIYICLKGNGNEQ